MYFPIDQIVNIIHRKNGELNCLVLDMKCEHEWPLFGILANFFELSFLFWGGVQGGTDDIQISAHI